MHVSAWNVALQTINFVVLAWLLQRFFFEPVRAVLARRQEGIAATIREAEAKKADAERLIDEYREKSSGIAREFERAREEALAAAEQEAHRLRDEAARQAAVDIDRAKGVVAQERLEATRALEARAADLAAAIAERLLRDAASDSDAPFLVRATAAIDALDGTRKAALVRQVGAGVVEVVSSRALEAGTRDRFERWLVALVGAPVPVTYRADSSLIAGVELKMPGGVWRFHWRASIQSIREELQAHAAAA